jgi:NAD(P)-dependent dehydrogenase (short-subunit alcohol dehydrogenase family)
MNIDLNVKGTAFALKYALAAIRKSKSKGSIVVNSSAMSILAKASFPAGGLYAAGKAALDMMVKYAAIEGAEAGASHFPLGFDVLS